MNNFAIIISAGAGPVEVRHFVALLSAELAEQCLSAGLKLLSTTAYGDSDAPRSVVLEVNTDPSASLGSQFGTHVLVAQSPKRGRHSRKRWFAGVSVESSLAPKTTIKIPESEVEVSTTRSGGPGGQHVNTTNSAVRILHRPSGFSVRVDSERSQHQNRRQAMRRLESLLGHAQETLLSAQSKARRFSHYKFERGSAVASWTLDAKGKGLCPS